MRRSYLLALTLILLLTRAQADEPVERDHFKSTPPARFNQPSDSNILIDAGVSEWNGIKNTFSDYRYLAIMGVSFALDPPVYRWVHKNFPKDGDRFLNYYIPNIGSNYFILGTLAAGTILNDRQMTGMSLATAKATFCGNQLNAFLQTATGRKSPRYTENAFDFNLFGSGGIFPSGHVMHIAPMVGVINTYSDNPIVHTIGYTLLGLMSAQRVTANTHWFSDVVVSDFLGYEIGRAFARREIDTKSDEELYGQQALLEKYLIGPNNQPRWTTQPYFPTTQIYVIPNGKVDFAWGIDYNVPPHGNSQSVNRSEIEIGLPARLQLNVSQVIETQDGTSAQSNIAQNGAELRWALAPWDAIWGNPTLAAVYTARDTTPDAQAVKLLLGGSFATHGRWAINLSRKWTLNKIAPNEVTDELNSALAYRVVNNAVATGLALKMDQARTPQSDGNLTRLNTIEMGPTLQIKPSSVVNLQFAALRGLTKESDKTQTMFIFGLKF